ncbi:MAG: hypothetical protein ACYDHM_00540 [Acidiferrobacterales bacterium]
MKSNINGARRGWSWIAEGWSLMRQDWMLWLVMTFVYMVIALALKMIPFIGVLILILISPAMLAGVLHGAHDLEAQVRGAKVGNERGARGHLHRSVRQLFSGFSREAELLPIMVISTLTLSAAVVIEILAQLLKVGGPALPAMLAGSVGPAIWLPALASLLIVLALQVALAMAIFYAVPLVLFKKEYPLSAIEKSFRACRHNALPLVAFGLPFALISTVADLLYFALDYPADYLALFVLGLITLPFFVSGLYRSYQDAFG